jgi:hypothetical protein
MSLAVQMHLFSMFSSILFVKVKLSTCLTKHYAMKTYEGEDVQITDFLS